MMHILEMRRQCGEKLSTCQGHSERVWGPFSLPPEAPHASPRPLPVHKFMAMVVIPFSRLGSAPLRESAAKGNLSPGSAGCSQSSSCPRQTPLTSLLICVYLVNRTCVLPLHTRRAQHRTSILPLTNKSVSKKACVRFLHNWAHSSQSAYMG